MIHNYISIDIETTGLNPKENKIIEIGAVKVKDGHMIDTFQSFVNPGVIIEENITKLTGITNIDIMDAPPIKEILPELTLFLNNEVILGHNILFDYSFLKKAFVNHSLSFEKSGIDTLKIARKYLPELEQKNLPFLCNYYGIQYDAHRALEDAIATHKLFHILQNTFSDDTDSLFQGNQLQYSIKKETPITKPQKERLYNLLMKHKIVIDFDLDMLTRNEASRYTDKILSKFGR